MLGWAVLPVQLEARYVCWGGPSYLYSQKPGMSVGVGRPTCTVRSQVGMLGWAVLPVQSEAR